MQLALMVDQCQNGAQRIKDSDVLNKKAVLSHAVTWIKGKCGPIELQQLKNDHTITPTRK